MLPALPPGTCKSSCRRPRRRQAAGRSTAPGTSGSWHSKNRHGLCLYAGHSARRHEFRRHGAHRHGSVSRRRLQVPALLRAGNAGQLHVAGLHGRHPLRCTLRDPYRGEFPGGVHAQHTARCGSRLHGVPRRPETDGQRHAPPRRFARGRALHPRGEGCRNGRLYRKTGADVSAPRNWPG